MQVDEEHNEQSLVDRLNRPFSERVFNRWAAFRNRHVSYTGRILILAGVTLGIFSMDIELRCSFVFWSILFAIGLVALLSTRLRRLRVSATRRAIGSVAAGARASYLVDLVNEGTKPVYSLHVREAYLPVGARAVLKEGLVTCVASLAPGERRCVRIATTFTQRGIAVLEGIRVEKADALDITRYGTTTPGLARVLVHPRSYPIASIDFSRTKVHQPGGLPEAQAIGESLEFVGLRDYMPGDSPRHISWKAWARTGEPVVKQYQGEYYRRVAIILDTRTRGRRDVKAFEGAVAVAASVVSYFERNEYIIDLFAAGDRVFYLQAGFGLGHMEQVLEMLATVESGTQARFPALDLPIRRLMGRLSGLVIVSVDWWAESQAFHQAIVHEVPEIKVITVRDGPCTCDPEDDIPNSRLYRKLSPETLGEEVLEL